MQDTVQSEAEGGVIVCRGQFVLAGLHIPRSCANLNEGESQLLTKLIQWVACCPQLSNSFGDGVLCLAILTALSQVYVLHACALNMIDIADAPGPANYLRGLGPTAHIHS